MTRRLSDAQRVFYRSQVTRRFFIISGLFLAWGFSPLGPSAWHSTRSLRLIAKAGIPWTVVSILALIYVALFLRGTTKAAEWGCWLGFAMYTVAFAAIVSTLRFDVPSNPWGIAAVPGLVVLHYQAGRLAHFQEETE